MVTTVQVEDGTLKLLKQLKQETNSKTYDEVIQVLSKKRFKSMAGALAGKKKYTSDEILKGLRDERDRF